MPIIGFCLNVPLMYFGCLANAAPSKRLTHVGQPLQLDCTVTITYGLRKRAIAGLKFGRLTLIPFTTQK
jgi:hypothetical protein